MVFLNEGDLIKFRKENIFEIPKWKSDNPISQFNLDWIRGNEET